MGSGVTAETSAGSIVKRLYVYGEAVAGSEAAKALAEEIHTLLREAAGVEPHVIKLPVATWVDEGAVVECTGLRVEGVNLPQTLGGEACGRLVEVKCTSPPCFNHVSEGDIVIAEVPEDPDDVTTLYVAAMERGASALLVYDRWPGRHRRIVVSGRWDYALLPSPAPMPAVHLRREDGIRLRSACLGSLVRLHASARIEWRHGRIIEAVIGSEGPEVLLIAHYDHWLGGSGDNLAGVAALIRAVERLRGRVGGWTLRVAVLDAEEFGDPQLPAWYWSYGSRWYARELLDSGLLRDIVAVLNLDMPVVKRLYLASTPELRNVVRAVAPRVLTLEPLEYETCYSDGYQFARLGVASATLYNIDEYLEYYHSDVDTPERPDYEAVEAAAAAYAAAALKLGERGEKSLDYQGYIETLVKLAERLPLEARRAAYMVAEEMRIALRAGNYAALREAASALNRVLGYCVFRGDYRWDTGGFTPMLAPWVRVATEEVLRAAEGSPRDAPGDAVIPGLEEHLAVAFPTPVRLWAKTRVLTPTARSVIEKALRHHLLDAARGLADRLLAVYEALRRTREL